MSTLDASVTDPDEHTHHSESEMITIGDLAVWHQMPFLSVRRLTQLNCPRWSMWDSSNIARISKARMLDDTRDWYFPIIVKKLLPESAHPSKWYGIWHSSAQQASERARPLPPMIHLPHEWLHFSNPQYHIIASAGGLLLIKGQIGVVPIRRSNPALADSNPSSISDTTKLAAGALDGQIKNLTSQSWTRLLVCNPLTRECRELPAADCLLPGMMSWDLAYVKGVQASMVVDEEANCYQVILTLSNFVAVYTSNTNSWNCLRFPKERPPRPLANFYIFVAWEYVCASAKVGGRVYFGDVQSTTASNAGMEPIQKATNAATLRLFEVNAETGKWEVVREFTLRKFHIPSLKYPSQRFDMDIIPDVKILECMGGLYAVLPAQVHDAWLIGESSDRPHGRKREALEWEDEFGRKLGIMPMCFYIMQLEGDGVDCGVLRIQVPLNQTEYHSRFVRFIVSKDFWHIRNWFSCEARGSVIWVACDDCVLSFDVMSRESKTQIISLDHDSTLRQYGGEILRFAYRPSLHMKP